MSRCAVPLAAGGEAVPDRGDEPLVGLRRLAGLSVRVDDGAVDRAAAGDGDRVGEGIVRRPRRRWWRRRRWRWRRWRWRWRRWRPDAGHREVAEHDRAVRVALVVIRTLDQGDDPGRHAAGVDLGHPVHAARSREVEVVEVRLVPDLDLVRAGADRGHRIPVRVLEVDRLVLANRADQVRVIRGHGVDSAVAEVVVGNRAAAAAARPVVRDRDGRIGGPRQELLGRGDVPDQVGARRPEQGHDADHVRAGHRGAAEGRVRGVTGCCSTSGSTRPGQRCSASCGRSRRW